MDNISFKANLSGINNSLLAESFKNVTSRDLKHTLKYLGKNPETQNDVFELLKDSKKTAEYESEFNTFDYDNISLNSLIKVFNILKIKEAKEFVANSIAEKQKVIALFEEHQMDKELDKEFGKMK